MNLWEFRRSKREDSSPQRKKPGEYGGERCGTGNLIKGINLFSSDRLIFYRLHPMKWGFLNRFSLEF
mgnify:CR=1 FL=1